MVSQAAIVTVVVLLTVGVVAMVILNNYGDQDLLRERDDVIEMEECEPDYDVPTTPDESQQSSPAETSTTRVNTPVACARPVTRFMFVKSYRAGSTTVAAILYRFGLTHDLNFVLPSNGDLLGWPFEIRPTNYLPVKPDLEYDVIVDRAVYRPDVFHYIFPNDMVYLGILRHPLTHLQSCFSAYALQRLYKLPSGNSIQTFLDEPYIWERKHHSQRDKRRPYSYIKNFQAYNYGYSLGLSEDLERTKKFVDRIASEFKVMLILEYLDESLVVLKREMCWETKDILYLSKLCCKKHKPLQLTDKQRESHRTFAAADYMLYERFTGILKDKTKALGQDFQDELQDFKKLNKQVQDFCGKGDGGERKLTMKAAKWHGKIVIDRKACQLAHANLDDLRKAARDRMVGKGKIVTTRRPA